METFLKPKLSALGAKFSSFDSREYAACFSSVAEEVSALRNSVVLSDSSWVCKFAADEGTGVESLDAVFAANVLKLRYGRALETFLARDDASVAAAATVVDVDDKLFVFAECANSADLNPVASAEGMRSIDAECVLLSVDGPAAWRVLKAVFGADIYNLTFMSAEKYDYCGEGVVVVRAGKTGEFGYQILAPNAVAEKLFDELKALVESFGGRLAGRDALLAARMKGNFFNVFAEGAAAKNPEELGLQWQIDFSKDAYCGSAAVAEVRESFDRRLVAVVCNSAISAGTVLFDSSDMVGEVVGVDASDAHFALAFVQKGRAYSGVLLSSSAGGVQDFKIVSRPAVLSKSLLEGMD